MIIDKHRPAVEPEEIREIRDAVGGARFASTMQEAYSTNALCEVFLALKSILSGLRAGDGGASGKPFFNTIKLNNGQLGRIKNDKWNREYGISFPAAFIHFINVRYLVQQSRIGEGRATARIQYVLNRLNNSDADAETEGYVMFQRINSAIQDNKDKFPALAERFQLEYFDQLESFDDGLQPYWIDYEVWFRDYSAYRYKNYVDRYIVMPPFTNHSDQLPECNPGNHPDHALPDGEEAAGIAGEQQPGRL